MHVFRPGPRVVVIAAAAGAIGLFAAGLAAAGGATTAATAPANTSSPAISGTPTQGSTLTASSGSWSGTTPITFTYAWQRCDGAGLNCASVAGATQQTYALTGDDVGKTVRVVVTATNSAGTGTASSTQTSVVSGTSAPTNTVAPAITGAATVGSTLTGSNGTWTGSSPIDYQTQWQRCDSSGSGCASISGETASTHTVATADVGHTLRIVVTASNAGGSGQATSSPTAVIGAAGPANTAIPTISGSKVEGQSLSTTNGTWSGATSITYAYAWYRCDTNGSNCAAIAGATAATYALTAADVGHDLHVIVTATNSTGSSSARSDDIGPVTASATTTTTTTTTPAPALGGTVRLPNGQTSVPAANVPETDRLTISRIQVSPSRIQGRAPVAITFTITETNKYVVSGALVYVLGLPYGWAAKSAEQVTTANGTVTISVAPTAKAPRTGALVLFVRARTPKGSLLAGSSTRRLIQVRIRP